MINLFFIPHDLSGANTYAQELTRFLSDQKDINLYVVNIQSKDLEYTEVRQDNITQIFIPAPRIASYKSEQYYSSCAKILYSSFSSLPNVIFHFNTHYTVELAKSVKQLFNCKIVCTIHFLDKEFSYFEHFNKFEEQSKYHKDIMQVQMLDLADKIICVTQFASKVIQEFYAINPSKMAVIPNGVTIPKLALINKEEQKKLLGFNTTDKIILYVGRITEMKGIDKLIQAFKELEKETPNIHLIIAGNGNYDDYLDQCSPIYGKITFTGSVSKEILYQFYSIADVGVLPSQCEQCSYVALEMMYFGVTVVFSNVPGLSELIESGQDGLLCPIIESHKEPFTLEADSSALKNLLNKLITNSNYALILGINAQKKAMKSHYTDNMGKQTMNVYNNLIREKIFANNQTYKITFTKNKST